MAEIAKALPEGAFATLWLSDGIDRAGRSALAAAVTGHGALTAYQSIRGVAALRPATMKDGKITVNALGDGLKSDDAEDTAKGYIAVEAGVIQITAGGDAIQAETDVVVTGGDFTLSTGGGSSSQIAEDA